jgi:hypothetical protein
MMNITISHKYNKEVRELSETNTNCLCALLNNETWSEVHCETDVNKKWVKLYSTFNYLSLVRK